MTSAASGELALQVLSQRVAACERPRSTQNQVSPTQIGCTSQEVEEPELNPKHNVVSIPKTVDIDGIIRDHHRLELDPVGLLIHTGSGEA